MAKSLLGVLESLNARIEELESRLAALNEKTITLNSENEALKRLLHEKDTTIAGQALDIEFLKVSHKLADSPDNIVAARQLMTRLIHTIDSAIALVKEE